MKNIPVRIDLPPEEQLVEVTVDGVTMIGPASVLAELREQMSRQREEVAAAKPALSRLADVMRNKTGQGYKLRALLYSLWNGQPTTLSDVCGLDHELRADLCLVIQAWGYGRGDWEFFYNEIRAVVSHAGLWEWFLDAETITAD